jgi:hypothetical protein
MDPQRFDTLVRALSQGEIAAAKKGKGKKGTKGKRRRKCRPESAAQTCAGTCGEVRNKCGKTVDCGSCACGSCQICQTCDAGSGQCIPNGSVVGQVCGARQVCQTSGTCACNATTCAGAGPGMTCGGGATPGVCGCTPQTNAAACGSQTCGTTQNNCGQTVPCTGCTGCCDGNDCLGGGAASSCGVSGAMCRACTPFETCGATGCEALPACGGTTNGPCRVFITSTIHRGSIGSVGDADLICQQLAADAGLPGFYQAWLSNDSEGPATRFVTQSPGPYWRIDGTQIASNWADLTNGSLAAPITINETGAPAGPAVWTNTKTDGTPGTDTSGASLSCQNWTSNSQLQSGNTGLTAETDGDWTAAGFTLPCRSALPLYCFQQLG